MDRAEPQQTQRSAVKEVFAAKRLKEAEIAIAHVGIDFERGQQDFRAQPFAARGLRGDA